MSDLEAIETLLNTHIGYINEKIDVQTDNVNRVCKTVAKLDERVDNTEKDVVAMRARSGIIAGITTLATNLIAMLIAYFAFFKRMT